MSRDYAFDRDDDGKVRRMLWLGDRPNAPKRRRLQLEEVVKPYGKVAAIHTSGGERSYFFIDKAGTVSVMPADCVEPETAD